MSTIRLSICIPTYNYGQFIGETLKGVVDQARGDVEVVVVDGGSTDNTSEIVTGFQKLFPWIAYHRLDKKSGIDKDMAKTVELARGDYCWLMSSDDVIKPGGIQRVLTEIENDNDIYLCNRTECDRNLTPVQDRLWLSEEIDDHIFNLSVKEELISYFNKSQSLGALFSYMSSIIVRRDRWNEIQYDERFTGSNYAHVFRLFSILLDNGTLKYVREPLVLCRGDNDSFAESGLFNRCMIDFDGYLLLALQLFPDDTVRRSFLFVMQRHYKWHDFVTLRHLAPDNASRKKLTDKFMAFGYPRTKLFFINIINSSRLIYATTRYFWRMVNIYRKR